MFERFRRLLAAQDKIAVSLLEIATSLTDLADVQREAGPAMERLKALELSREQWEATCEGLLLKAEGKLRAANNAEARERALRRTYEHLIDPLVEVGVEAETPGRDLESNHDAGGGEAEGVPPVRVDVAPSDKTLRLRRKYGV